MNGTQAAIRAGYSPKTARNQSSRMLTSATVQQYLSDLRSQQQQRTQINADAVLRELAIVGFSKITDVLNIDQFDCSFKSDLSEEAKASIQSITILKTTHETDRGVHSSDRLQVKMHSKISALKELGVHFGLFNDFNGAIATLKQYGTVEPTEDGHVYKSGFSSKTDAAC